VPPTQKALLLYTRRLGCRASTRAVLRQLRTRSLLREGVDEPIPNFVLFNHSVHAPKGIGCALVSTGRVDEMNQVFQPPAPAR